MPFVAEEVDHYDRRTIALHWASAVLLIFMWVGAHAIDWFPKGPLRVDARATHISVGLILLVLILYRLSWRFSSGVRIANPPGVAWTLAKLMHYSLYVLVIATLLLGIANAWVRGDDMFGFFKIPAFGDYEKAARHALSEQIVGWHRLLANAVLVLAGVHALSAFIHHFTLRDRVLGRMLPFVKA